MNLKIHAVILLTSCVPSFASADLTLTIGGAESNVESPVSVPIVLKTHRGAAAALQWTLELPASGSIALQAQFTAGPAARVAGKTLDCVTEPPGAVTCLMAGVDAEPIADGVLAVMTLAGSSGPKPVDLTLSQLVAASTQGGELATESNSFRYSTAGQPGSASGLESLSCLEQTLASPGSTACRVNLRSPAPSGGLRVTLYRSPSEMALQLPDSLFVPEATTSAWFIVEVPAGLPDGSALIEAELGSARLGAVLQIHNRPAERSAATASVRFLRSDVITQGNWTGIMGSDGFAIPGFGTQLPNSVQMRWNDPAESVVWERPSTDVRALSIPPPGEGRIASGAFLPDSFTLALDLGGEPRELAIYFLDWEQLGCAEEIKLVDVDTGEVLDSRVAAGFSQGLYLLWEASGSLEIRIKRLAGERSVVNGLFFGPEKRSNTERRPDGRRLEYGIPIAVEPK